MYLVDPRISSDPHDLLCNFFLHIFGLLIAMFLGTSYEYTP